jgi:hypothetical protein
MRQLNNPSPFPSPLEDWSFKNSHGMTMGAKQKLSHLVWAFCFPASSGMVCISFWAHSTAAVVPHPLSMLFYSLVGLTVLYLITIGVRYLLHFVPQINPLNLSDPPLFRWSSLGDGVFHFYLNIGSISRNITLYCKLSPLFNCALRLKYN